MSATLPRCTQRPISWLELERYVLGESRRDSEIEAHLLACQVCTHVLQRIREDDRRMPGISVPIAAVADAPGRAWSWRWALAVLTPLALLLLIVALPERRELPGTSGVKGSEASFELIRERGGRLLVPSHFADGDRFKVFITCAPDAQGLSFADLVVEQGGQRFYPLPSARIECGNRVVLPGAFSLEGGAARLCIRLDPKGPPSRDPLASDAMCTDLLPAESESQ